MQSVSVEKLFAVVDRKVGAFDFSVKKVKGKQTGNEYYAVSGACIINGENFRKNVLTIGCPKKAIESIVRAILGALNVPAAMPEGIAIRKVEAPVAAKVTLTAHKDGIGLRRLEPVATPVEEVDEDEYEQYDEDECPECGMSVDFCECDEDDEDTEETSTSGITLTPARETSSGTTAPHTCPYCGARVAPNFAYCPQCGGQQ